MMTEVRQEDRFFKKCTCSFYNDAIMQLHNNFDISTLSVQCRSLRCCR